VESYKYWLAVITQPMAKSRSQGLGKVTCWSTHEYDMHPLDKNKSCEY
jgi:hypothetical protein